MGGVAAEHRPGDGKQPIGDRIVFAILVVLGMPFAVFFLWLLVTTVGSWDDGTGPGPHGH
ncbi:hypothetical protein [Kitasatospora sp. NPDC058190]|uniref:hypothetical protein n=1 Tax=Kitasatospora sp. NPDC058190 TaxID=3346371 RepID=UPI0036DF6D6A